MLSQISIATLFAAAATSVSAHGYPALIMGGAKGAASMGFTITKATNFLRSETAQGLDWQAFRGGCGGTEPKPASDVTAVNIPNGIAKAEAAGLPSVDMNGKLAMSWMQINAGSDGAGPVRCMIDVTGKGDTWKNCGVTKNVGDGGGLSTNPMEIQIDPKTVCTGGSGSTCLVKVLSPNQFGSCFAVKSPASGSMSNNNNNAAAAGGTKTVTVTVTAAATACKMMKRGHGEFQKRL